METFCILLLQEQFHKCTILKVSEKVSKCETISDLEQYQNPINQRDYILYSVCVWWHWITLWNVAFTKKSALSKSKMVMHDCISVKNTE